VLSFLRRGAPGVGLVYFPAARTPEPGEVRRRLERWEDAEASAAPDAPPLGELLRFSSAVTDGERRVGNSPTGALLVRVLATENNLLRDRKQLLRALRVAMGDDGVMAADVASTLPWSPSDTATELAAERARQTVGVLRGLVEEFAELGLPALIKLGYPRDDGGGREHLWFSVHRLDDASVDATLENRPYASRGCGPASGAAIRSTSSPTGRS
jgi:hypothetical protein